MATTTLRVCLWKAAGQFISTVRVLLAMMTLTYASLVAGCGSGDRSDPGPVISDFSTVGAVVGLAWDPVEFADLLGYVVHYGNQSPNESGSCNYELTTFTTTPSATVTHLDPNSLYYFAVSSYNGAESACSNEVSTVTTSLSG
jgi:hypothetical protein